MNDTLNELKTKTWTFKKIFALTIFGAIILVFVFFGLPSKLNNMGGGSLGRVNDTLLSLQDLQQEENRISQQYQSMLGANFDISSQRQFIQTQAVQSMIQNELLSQGLAAEHLTVTDEEIRDLIVKGIPAFQENGQFQRDYYDRYIESTHTSATEFEKKLRRDLTLNKYQRLAFGSGELPESQAKALAALDAVQWNISFAKLDLANLGADEKAQAESVAALEAALKAKDEKAVNDLLKKYKGSWEDTGYVSVQADSLPKLQSSDVMEVVSKLSPQNKWADRLAQQDKSKIVLKLKDFKTTTPVDKDIKANQKKLSGILFEGWFSQVKKTAKVEVNTEMLKN